LEHQQNDLFYKHCLHSSESATQENILKP